MVGDSMTSEVIEDEKEFYSKAKTYWKEVPATVDGMLGGYGHISNIDVSSSRKFLQRFLRVGGSGCPTGAEGAAQVLPVRAGHCLYILLQGLWLPGHATRQGWLVDQGLCLRVTRQEVAVLLGDLWMPELSHLPLNVEFCHGRTLGSLSHV